MATISPELLKRIHEEVRANINIHESKEEKIPQTKTLLEAYLKGLRDQIMEVDPIIADFVSDNAFSMSIFENKNIFNNLAAKANLKLKDYIALLDPNNLYQVNEDGEWYDIEELLVYYKNTFISRYKKFIPLYYEYVVLVKRYTDIPNNIEQDSFRKSLSRILIDGAHKFTEKLQSKRALIDELYRYIYPKKGERCKRYEFIIMCDILNSLKGSKCESIFKEEKKTFTKRVLQMAEVTNYGKINGKILRKQDHQNKKIENFRKIFKEKTSNI